MKVCLKDLLSMEFFSDSKLIAGNKGIKNVVSAVTVVDSPGGINWLKGEELILTTAYIIRSDNEKQVDFIKKLSKKGVSALGIKLRYLGNKLPEDMKKKADELNFPIFTIPEKYRWRDIFIFVNSYIFNEKTKELKKTEYVYQDFLDNIFNGNGFISVVQLLQQWTGLKAAILYNEKLYHNSINEDLVNIISLRTTWTIDEIIINDIDKNPIHIYIHGDTYNNITTKWTAIDLKCNKKWKGSVILLNEFSKLSETNFLLLQYASAAAKIEIQRIETIKSIQSNYKTMFLLRLIKGQIKTFEVASFIAKDFEWSLSKRNSVLLFNVNNIKFSYDFFNYIDNYFEKNIIKGLYSNKNFIVLLPENFDKNIIAKDLYTKLKNLFNNDFSLGIGRVVTINNLLKSFREANKIIEMSNKGSLHRTLFEYEKLGFFRLMLTDNLTEELHFYVDDFLGPILKSDIKNKIELLTTLRIFLENDCNYSLAGKELFMHPNTIRYRIQSIEKLCDINLSSKSERLNIQIALQLIEFYNDEF